MQERAAAEASSPYYTPEHEAFRDTVRRFVAKEIEPFAAEWDEAGEFPRELYKKAAGHRRAAASDSPRSTAASRAIASIA